MALWAAPKWQTRDKVIGTAAALLVPILLGLLLGIGIATGGVAVRSGTVLAAVITPDRHRGDTRVPGPCRAAHRPTHCGCPVLLGPAPEFP
ncbi:hypothetical protein [Streptomyces sp. NPDC006971]|uniref:hypothetical protein n=1 Tax=Streptomyces sp. NPDC006971 TaxID=3154784 RepID=UPI00340B11D5